MKTFDNLSYDGRDVPPETLRYSAKILSKAGKVLVRGLRIPEGTVRTTGSVELCGSFFSPDLIAGACGGADEFSLFALEKQGVPKAPRQGLEKGKTISLACEAFPAYHYTCYVPTSCDPSRPAPLVVFDNAGGKAKPLMPAMAEELGWVSVGLTESNNANVVDRAPSKNEACSFAVLLDVRRRLSIDPRRVFYAGFSGGAFRSHSRAIRFEDEPAAGVLDIGMGLLYAPSHGIPTFYVMGKKDSHAKSLLEGFADTKERYGDLVALRTHPGGHVFDVPDALAEGMRWLAGR